MSQRFNKGTNERVEKEQILKVKQYFFLISTALKKKVKKIETILISKCTESI